MRIGNVLIMLAILTWKSWKLLSSSEFNLLLRESLMNTSCQEHILAGELSLWEECNI